MDYPRSTEEHRMRQHKRKYDGANVKFFDAYPEDYAASQKEGRPIYKTVPSVSIQWPGMDETVVAMEPHHIQEYPDLYAAYKQGGEAPQSGTPLEQWAMLPGNVVKELKHFACRTVEQLAAANDDFKRRLGPLSKYCKEAEHWLKNADAPQSRVTALEKQLEREQKKTKKLEDQIHLLMQRIEAVEGTRLHDTSNGRN